MQLNEDFSHEIEAELNLELIGYDCNENLLIIHKYYVSEKDGHTLFYREDVCPSTHSTTLVGPFNSPVDAAQGLIDI